jgi:1-deoxy-D-xylulose-5-phosphate reductoisomerase
MTAHSPLPRQTVAVLGSTGSIGTQTLDVLNRFAARFQVVALAAGSRIDDLAQQCHTTQPSWVSTGTPEGAQRIKQLGLPAAIQVCSGPEGLVTLATLPEIDIVVVGLTGLIGLAPTLAALKAGKKVLTANKETFVAGGHLVAPYLNQIIPLDSEHSAIHQCLQGPIRPSIHRLWLTASGGPFRNTPAEALQHVTPEQALKHPNWVMGPKVTIDSATLMNKGLEVIEARWLFGVDLPRIEIVIHPQSMVHSGVAFADGAVLVQMGVPDMRLPIQYGLTYPERLPGDGMSCHLDLTQLGSLDFAPPDLAQFPCLGLAYQAAALGASACVALNAADEVAVPAFLQGQHRFTDIPRTIEKVLEHTQAQGFADLPSLEEVEAIDHWARHIAGQHVAKGIQPVGGLA